MGGEIAVNDKIVYASENGYAGVLYGKSGYAVYDKDGHRVFHTGFRTINTMDELVEQIEEMPDFLKMLEEQENE